MIVIICSILGSVIAVEPVKELDVSAYLGEWYKFFLFMNDRYEVASSPLVR